MTGYPESLCNLHWNGLWPTSA